MEALLPNANPALAGAIDTDKLGLEEKKSIRVLVSIPNEGHAPVESYANRLVNMMHLGKLEERQKLFNLIDKHFKDEESKQKLLIEYWEGKEPDYQKILDGKIFDFYFYTVGRILTPLAREKAAEEAVRGNFDYLYQIDDDMICPDDLFERLYRHNVDIVSPLAFTRNPPYFPVAYENREYWDSKNSSMTFVNDTIKNYPKNVLFRTDANGFGAVLIKVDIIRKMKQPWFMSTTGTGEDILFCYKATKAGAKVYMDSSTKLGHLSHPIQVTEEYATDYWNKNNLEIEKKNGIYEKYVDVKNKVLLGDR